MKYLRNPSTTTGLVRTATTEMGKHERGAGESSSDWQGEQWPIGGHRQWPIVVIAIDSMAGSSM